MFCCMTGKKDPPQRTDRKQLPKTKKPEDFMRQAIPLALSEKITFTFDRNHKWSCDVADEGRARKKEDAGIKEKFENMRQRLKGMQMQDNELKEKVKMSMKADEQLEIELAELKAKCQKLQCAIAINRLEIRKCKQRSDM